LPLFFSTFFSPALAEAPLPPPRFSKSGEQLALAGSELGETSTRRRLPVWLQEERVEPRQLEEEVLQWLVRLG